MRLTSLTLEINKNGYNPKAAENEPSFRIQLDRVAHWVAQGAQPSGAVKKLIKRGKAQLAAKPEAPAQ